MNRLPSVFLAALLCAPMAAAQTQTPELDTLETREAQPRQEAPRRRGLPAGVQIMRPAALLFASFDSDGDLAISAEELDAGLARVFPGVDTNKDGSASLLEYANWSERALGAREAIPGRVAIDPNLDNTVTEAEFFAAFRGRANVYGLDDTGEISFKALSRPVEFGDGPGEGAEEAGGPGGPGGGRGGPPFREER